MFWRCKTTQLNAIIMVDLVLSNFLRLLDALDVGWTDIRRLHRPIRGTTACFALKKGLRYGKSSCSTLELLLFFVFYPPSWKGEVMYTSNLPTIEFLLRKAPTLHPRPKRRWILFQHSVCTTTSTLVECRRCFGTKFDKIHFSFRILIEYLGTHQVACR